MCNFLLYIGFRDLFLIEQARQNGVKLSKIDKNVVTLKEEVAELKSKLEKTERDSFKIEQSNYQVEF